MFDTQFNVIGMVHAVADPHLMVTPVATILEHLDRRGLRGVIGRDLS